MARKSDAESRKRHRKLLGRLDEIDEQMDDDEISIGDTAVSTRLDELRGVHTAPRRRRSVKILGYLIVIGALVLLFVFSREWGRGEGTVEDTPAIATDEVTSTLEPRIAELEAELEALRVAMAPTDAEDNSEAVPAEDPLALIAERLQQLETRQEDLDGRLSLFDELDPAQIDALRQALADLRESKGIALSSLQTSVQMIERRLDGIERSLDDVSVDLGAVERVTTSSFWTAIDEWAVAADTDYDSVIGKPSPDSPRGYTVYTALDPFPSAEATEVWDDGRERFCRVTFDTSLELFEGQGRYQKLRDRLVQSLPPGWTTTRVIVSGASVADEFRRTADDVVFVLTLREIRDSRRKKVYRTAFDLVVE